MNTTDTTSTNYAGIYYACYSMKRPETFTGTYIIIQAGDLFQIWGNLTLMVSTSLLLFTNVAFGMKIINVMMRRKAVLAIIDEGDDELAAMVGVEEICTVKRFV